MASILDRLLGRVPSGSVQYFDTAPTTRAGEVVSAEDALNNPTVMTCINIITQNIAQLNYKVCRKTETGIEVLYNDPLMKVLSAPNEYQTRFDFISSIVNDILQYGNAYTRVIRSSNQVVTALVPMDPEYVEISQNAVGMPMYRDLRGDGKLLNAMEVIHFKDVAGHEDTGRSRVELAAEIIGPLKAANRQMGDTFRHGVSVNYSVELDATLDDQAREQLYTNLRKNFGNRGSNRGGIAVLEGGKMSSVKGSTPADLDLRELRNNLINEIAAVFRIPLSMVGTGGNITYNNYSAMRSGFYSDSLVPIICNIEQALTKRLIRDDRYIKFDVEEIIKGDPASQMAYATAGVSNGIMTPNEGRMHIGLDPIEGGDELASNGPAVEAEDPNQPDPESDTGNTGEMEARDE